MMYNLRYRLKSILLFYYALGLYITLMVLFVYCNYTPLVANLIHHPLTGHPGLARISPSGFVFTKGPQWIPDCRCSRRYFYSGSTIDERIKLNSTCSDEGTFYYLEQKVISFSWYLYRDNETETENLKTLFRQRIQANLQAMRTHYSGYTMRIYTNYPASYDSFCDLVCKNTDLFWCNVRETPCLGDLSRVYYTNWKALPLGDDTVDVFLSRDWFSLLTAREAAAVYDWLNQPQQKPIQLMRDQDFKHSVNILGGQWGARNFYFDQRLDAKRLRSAVLHESMVAYFGDSNDDTRFGQKVLSRVVYAKNLEKIVAYDSYHCVKFANQTLVRPFPVQRKDIHSDYVGTTGVGTSNDNLTTCPVACRPSHGKDWEYC